MNDLKRSRKFYSISDVNTDEDIKNYLKENFSADKLESEINNKNKNILKG